MPSMQKFYISIKKHNYIPYVVLFDKEKDYIQDQVMDYGEGCHSGNQINT